MTPTVSVCASVSVCRGCCCGTDKHPDTDHEGQLAQFRAAGIRLKVADCLDVCEHSNVVVVHPRPAVRRWGARPVWLGGILDPELTQHVVDWALAGGPGDAPIPDRLRERVIDKVKD